MRNIHSNSHIHKKEYGIVARKYEFVRPKIDKMNYILKDTIKECKKKCFQSFENKCVHDIKYINIENNEEGILSITLGFMKYKSQNHGLGKISKCKKKLF